MNKFKEPGYENGVPRVDMIWAVLYAATGKELRMVLPDFERLMKDMMDEGILTYARIPIQEAELRHRATVDGMEWTYTLLNTPAAAAEAVKAQAIPQVEVKSIPDSLLRRRGSGIMRKACPIPQLKVVGRRNKKINARRVLQPVLDLVAAEEDGENNNAAAAAVATRKSSRIRTTKKKY